MSRYSLLDQLVRVQVIRVRGTISMADAFRIRELVHEFVLRAEAKVILNCEAVTDVDCGAAEVLGSAGRYLRDYRGDLVVVRATREVKAVFNLTGAELQFADTEDDGVRLYGGKP